MKIISIANHKGGVGKTTTAINLSAALCKLGKTVLIIDLDPQGHSTIGVTIEYNNSCFDDLMAEKYTIADVMTEDALLKEAIYPTSTEGLFIVPSDISLAVSEIKLSSQGAREFKLRKAISKIIPDCFDFILIDCPPTFGSLSINAIVASDYIVLPLQLSYFSLDGVSNFLDTLSFINREISYVIGHETKILGVLLTFYDLRACVHRVVDEAINSTFGNKVFNAKIPQNVSLNEAQSRGKSIFDHKPESKGAEAYMNLAKEFLERING